MLFKLDLNSLIVLAFGRSCTRRTRVPFGIQRAMQGIKDQRLRGMRAVGELLAARGALRAGLDAQAAGDVIWGLTDARLYQSFVQERAWAADRYARWLGDALCALLLPS